MTGLANGSSLSPAEATTNSASSSVSLRTAALFRAAIPLVVGLFIAFTAPLHENVMFNKWVIAGAFGLLCLAMLLEYVVRSRNRSHGSITIRTLLLFLAAITALLTSDALGISAVVAVWASANSVVLFVTAIPSSAPRKQVLPAAFLSLALAIAVVIFRYDPVGVIGFFGMYTLICGVFLGISAFEARPASSITAQRPASGEQEPNNPHAEHSPTTTS